MPIYLSVILVYNNARNRSACSPSPLMHEVHISDNSWSNSHSCGCSNTHKSSCCKDTGPGRSSTRRGVGCDCDSRYKNEDRPPTVHVRNWRPYQRRDTCKDNRDCCLIRCFHHADVQGLGERDKRGILCIDQHVSSTKKGSKRTMTAWENGPRKARNDTCKRTHSFSH